MLDLVELAEEDLSDFFGVQLEDFSILLDDIDIEGSVDVVAFANLFLLGGELGSLVFEFPLAKEHPLSIGDLAKIFNFLLF